MNELSIRVHSRLLAVHISFGHRNGDAPRFRGQKVGYVHLLTGGGAGKDEG